MVSSLAGAAALGVPVDEEFVVCVTTTSRRHAACDRPSSSRRSKTMRAGALAPAPELDDAAPESITVRTMRSRFERANGPTRARSSTDHAAGALPDSGTALCTSGIHSVYRSSSRTYPSTALTCAVVRKLALSSMACPDGLLDVVALVEVVDVVALRQRVGVSSARGALDWLGLAVERATQ